MLRKASGSILTILALGIGWGCGDSPPPSDQIGGSTAASLPAGYALRIDRSNRDPRDFKVTAMPSGVSVVTGPTGILYRAADAATSGDYTVSATFTEIAAPRGHREGFGLFIGGQDLEGPDQRYTYFLVRADGRYLIKSRVGDSTSNVSDGWLEADAIVTAGRGDVVNELRVQVAGDRVHFQCNGSELAELSTADVEAHGVAGIRVNHNLTVQVAGFTVER